MRPSLPPVRSANAQAVPPGGGAGAVARRSGLGKKRSWYTLVPSPFGQLLLGWKETPAGLLVDRLLLPRQRDAEEWFYVEKYDTADPPAPIAELAAGLIRFLEGEAVRFPLEMLDLAQCSEFQQRVLRAEHAIPRGRVSTYGRIARHLGQPGAARGVGRALARNPFPLLIPCHRAIAADGTLGGYQGGLAMKRALLEMEGVTFSSAGRVEETFYYGE